MNSEQWTSDATLPVLHLRNGVMPHSDDGVMLLASLRKPSASIAIDTAPPEPLLRKVAMVFMRMSPFYRYSFHIFIDTLFSYISTLFKAICWCDIHIFTDTLFKSLSIRYSNSSYTWHSKVTFRQWWTAAFDQVRLWRQYFQNSVNYYAERTCKRRKVLYNMSIAEGKSRACLARPGGEVENVL